MNMFKKNGGFTLVELIVVIAILAILAGIAVPAYSGYIARAEETKDIATLEAVQTAALAAASLNAVTTTDITITTDTNGNITKVELGTSSKATVYDSTVTTNVPKIQEDFLEFIESDQLKVVVAANKNATITEITTGWTAATNASGT